MSAEERWQGLLFARCIGDYTRIAPTGRELVYLEFVEIAPWNWGVAEIGQEPRLKGIGSQLFDLAVRWSVDLGFRGRIGLHSLPQADAFYRRHCGMQDFGFDSGYNNLRYFELDERHARTFLEEAWPGEMQKPLSIPKNREKLIARAVSADDACVSVGGMAARS